MLVSKACVRQLKKSGSTSAVRTIPFLNHIQSRTIVVDPVMEKFGPPKLAAYYPEIPKPAADKPIPWREEFVSLSDELLKDFDPKTTYKLPLNISHSRTHSRFTPEVPRDQVTNFEFDTPKDAKLKVAVYNRGKGRRPPAPVLCLHDAASNHKIFSGVVRHMNYPYGLLAMDLRGRGDSYKFNAGVGKYSLSRHAEDVIRVLDHFHLTRATLVGHGLGGYIALYTARRYPDRVEGIVLVNGGSLLRQQGVTLMEDPNLNRLNKEYGSLAEYLEQLGKKESDLSIDEREYYEYALTKNENGKLVSKVRYEVATEDLSEIKPNYWLLQEDSLFRVRHPMAVVHSEKGFTENDAPVLSPAAVKDLEHYMMVKFVSYVKGATHDSVLLNNDFAKQVAEQIDAINSKYDRHRFVELFKEEYIKQNTKEEKEL